ncbi:MAG: hypothetical protein R3A51_10125 [Nannocystaceae bacterium]
MSTSDMLIPASIVVGSVIIAGALYMALRPPSSAAPAPAIVEAPTSVAPPPVVAPVVAAPRVATVVDPQARATAAVRDALASQRAQLRDACWTAPAAGEPLEIPLVMSVGFDSEGRSVSVGISEDRAAARPEVANCLRAHLFAFSIPAPGVPVHVEAPFVAP